MNKAKYIRPQTEVIQVDSHCMVVEGSTKFIMRRGTIDDDDPNASRRRSSWSDDDDW